MSLHDAYARRTPFELAFQDPDALSALTGEVARESSAGGADPTKLHAFVTMGSVGSFVNALQGAQGQPEALHQYGALVFHAAYFQEDGRPLYLLETHAARYLVEGVPEGNPVPPSDSGYLQLPQHLFWIVEEGADAPESIDGLFWVVSRERTLYVLLVTGVRPDRPGFGTIPLPEAPLADATTWLSAKGRRDGEDYSSTLPGAEVDGLYSVQSTGEILKLLARFFAYVERVPAARREVAGGTASEGAPRASDLPYTVVGLA